MGGDPLFAYCGGRIFVLTWSCLDWVAWLCFALLCFGLYFTWFSLPCLFGLVLNWHCVGVVTSLRWRDLV